MIVLSMSMVLLKTSSRSKVDAARMLPICFIDSSSRSRFVTEAESLFFSIASDRVGVISSTFSVRPVEGARLNGADQEEPGDCPPIFSGTTREDWRPGLTKSSRSSGCCMPSVCVIGGCFPA